MDSLCPPSGTSARIAAAVPAGHSAAGQGKYPNRVVSAGPGV